MACSIILFAIGLALVAHALRRIPVLHLFDVAADVLNQLKVGLRAVLKLVDLLDD